MKKHITAEELKRMNKLAGLINEGGDEDYPDFQKNMDIDWEDVARERNREIIRRIESEFGPENVYSGSADWGGIPTWSVLGGKFEGYFIIDDKESQSDDAFTLMKRTFNEEKEESEDEIIFTAFVTPERYGDEGDGTIDELLAKAKEIKETGGDLETPQTDEIPPYEGPENPMDNQVTEDMIREGELGKAIARILKEELSKK